MVATGLLIGFGALRFTIGAYNRQLLADAAQLLNLSVASIENELRRVEHISQTILADPNLQGQLRAVKASELAYEGFQARSSIDNMLISHALSEPYINSIHIIDSRGNQTSVGVHSRALPAEQWGAILERALPAEGRIVWIPPGGEDDSLIAARIIRQIEELSLDYLGLLILRISMKELFDLFAENYPSAAMNLHIFAPEGTVFSSGPLMKLEQIWPDLIEDDRYGIEKIEGRRYIVSYTRPRYTGWTYLYLLPYESVYQQTLSVTRTVTLLYLAVMILALWAAIWFIRGITRPVERLESEMKRVEQGEFTLPEAPDSAYQGVEEIDRLHRHFRVMVQKINTLIEENYAKQLVLKDTQYKALQAQINPHFLYNTLDTVHWLARLGEQQEIATVVEALGTLLRKSISQGQSVISLREELEIVKSYIAIQRIRFGDRLRFRLDIGEAFLGLPIPKLTLQPLVENAINYGLEKTEGPVHIAVWVERCERGAALFVEDDGPGMDPGHLKRVRRGEGASSGSGIGLRNIDERLRMLFGEAYSLEIDSRPGEGVRVTLFLPEVYEEPA